MRLRNAFSVTVACAALLTSIRPACAHHAFAAEFDAERPLTLRGSVTKMEWSNPHVWIFIDVKGADGKTESWEIEGGAPNALLRRGWTKNSLPPGTEIVVKGYGSKDGTNRATGRDLEFPDGRKLFAGSNEAGAPDNPPAKK